MSWLRSRALGGSMRSLFPILRYLGRYLRQRLGRPEETDTEETDTEETGTEETGTEETGTEEVGDLIGGQAGRGDARRDPDAIVGSAADGQASGRGRPGADPAHPVQVPDRVLRQSAAPASDQAGCGGAPDAGRGGEVGGGEGDQVGVVALQHGFLTDPAEGAADAVRGGFLPAFPPAKQVRPFDRAERRRLDGPAVDRWYQVAGAGEGLGEGGGPVGEGDDRHARVLDRGQVRCGWGRAGSAGQ